MGKWDNIEYRTLVLKDKTEVTALVGPYRFTPEGTEEDWIKYAEEQAELHGWAKTEVYRQTQDKETGYSSYNLVGTIIKDIPDFMEGWEETHLVVKWADIHRLWGGTKLKLREVLDALDIQREVDNRPVNRYLVINADEPYAPEIVEILKKHGAWGK